MGSRRDFLKASVGAIAGAGAFWSSLRVAKGQFPPPPPTSPPLEPFVDPLPLPPVLRPVRPGFWLGRWWGLARALGPHYELPMLEVSQKLHRDLPPTRVWGYGGMY
ncbi:MAG TPA: twin-arginine translocation signal domain-containing protein, partial [Bryobacteraceae bacterium]|nr:twin-arginine translocation signal domain-containing protein [Bryobacteraceae bacterium]